jgi:hypothetical protein
MIRFSLLLALILIALKPDLLAGTNRAGQQLQGNSDATCAPRIGLVSPEFIVLDSKTPLVSILGVCLNKKNIIAVPEGTSAAVLPLKDPKQKPYTASGYFEFTNAGHYTICISGEHSQCTAAQGPTITVVDAQSCTGSGRDDSIRLESEPSPPPPDIPITASCDLPDPHDKIADKIIVVNGATGRACTANHPLDPNNECIDFKKDKKPLLAKPGDVVQIYVDHKNPFRESYKFSSTEAQINDDNIGSFLALLVPGLGGGGSTKSPSDTQSKNPSSAAKPDNLNDANAMIANLESQIKNVQSPGFQLRPDQLQELAGNFNQVRRLQNNAENDLRFQQPHPAENIESQQASQAATNALASSREKGDEQDRLLGQIEGKRSKQSIAQMYKTSRERQLFLELAQVKKNEIAQPATTNGQTDHLDSCQRVISDRIDTLITNYTYFALTYNDLRNTITKTVIKRHGEDCEHLSERAQALWEMTNRQNEKILDARLSLSLRALAAAAQRKSGKTGSGKGTVPAGPTPLDTSITASTCLLKALQANVSPALSGSITALEKVLLNPNSFVSSFQIGPYADSTQVDWTLTKTLTQPVISGLSISAFNTAIDDCISPSAKPDNPQKKDGSAQLMNLRPVTAAFYPSSSSRPHQAVLLNASFPIAENPVFLALPQKAKSGAQKSGVKKTGASDSPASSSDSGSQQTPSGSSGDDSTTTTRGRRINFGAERFIVSIGMAGAALGQSEFGKGLGQPSFDTSGNPLSGLQQITSIVIQKNSSSYRLSPMAFLNTRIFQPASWVNATYATFGITAKSDAPGVRPEYMLGLSQSFADRHLLLTVGAYAGQQSSLGAGLKVNQALPSGSSAPTGDLAIDSRYRFKFAAAISWRVPGLSK